MTPTLKLIVISAALTIGGAATSPAFAANDVMKVCGAKYQAAKTAKTLPAGQTWNQFLAQCRGTVAKPAATTAAAKPAPVAVPAAAAKPARAAPAAKPARAPSQATAAQQAMYARERQCGAQWKTDKAAGRTGSQTWPQYWSACNKRMK